MVHRRKSDTYHQGERAENKARSEAKKPIEPDAKNGDYLLANADIDPKDAAAMTRIVHRMARDDGDCADLLDKLGLREVG